MIVHNISSRWGRRMMIKMIMIMNTASIVPMLASSSGERVSGFSSIKMVA